MQLSVRELEGTFIEQITTALTFQDSALKMGKNTSIRRGPKRNPTAEKIRSNSRLLSDRHSGDDGNNGSSRRSSATHTRSDDEEGATVAGLADASRRNPTRGARKRTIEEDEGKNGSARGNKRSNGGQLYLGANKCGQCTNGRGGILLSNAAKETEETTSEVAVDGAGADEEVQSPDLFDGSAFRTSSNKRIDEDVVRRDLNNTKSTEKLKILIDETAGSIISLPYSPEHKALVGIIHYLLEEGHIEALSAESLSTTDPKFSRSGLSMIGTHKKILEKEQAGGYCVAKTAYGAKVLKKLGLAVAANNEAVGANGAKTHVYELIWKGVPIATKRVGPSDEGKKVEHDIIARPWLEGGRGRKDE